MNNHFLQLSQQKPDLFTQHSFLVFLALFTVRVHYYYELLFTVDSLCGELLTRCDIYNKIIHIIHSNWSFEEVF